MRISIKTLIAVLLIVMSFAEVQAVHVLEVIELSGTVFDVDQHFRRIWITPDDGETLEIIGFPFYNLEAVEFNTIFSSQHSSGLFFQFYFT